MSHPPLEVQKSIALITRQSFPQFEHKCQDICQAVIRMLHQKYSKLSYVQYNYLSITKIVAKLQS